MSNMSLNLGGWIHNFTVTDTQTHKEGYTLYKITSVVFPRSLPQALSCLVVWKRFHDVKRLHRELKKRQKSLQLPELPELTDYSYSSYFKRFDADVIQKRKEHILKLLDFAALHPPLYKCHAFVQFFSEIPSSRPQCRRHTHSIQPEKNINRNKIKSIPGTEDIRYLEIEAGVKAKADNVYFDNAANKIKNISNDDNSIEKIGKASLLAPMASAESSDSDYIYEAALELSYAVKAEVNHEYSEAYTRYKRGVELLLLGSKNDNDEERKFIAKSKIIKYLARADDINEKFLKNPNRNVSSSLLGNFQLTVDIAGNNDINATNFYLERPWNHMAKYKVLRVLGDKVLLVQCVTETQKPQYVMKGIEKPSSNSPTQSIFLPQHVRYMVDLVAFFQNEQKIFLLLKFAQGGRLFDYICNYERNCKKPESMDKLFPELSNDKDIRNNRNNQRDEENSSISMDTEDIVKCSKQLLKSVDHTLKESVDGAGTCQSAPAFESHDDIPLIQYNKLPEASIKQWARELLIAIHSLHEKGIILGDLHSDNILLGDKGQILLTYFYQNEGFCSDGYIHKELSPRALSGHFVAPEKSSNFKSDWWSYGVILYEILLGLPFKDAHPGQIDMYSSVQYPENMELSEPAQDLLEKLLEKIPEERIDYEQIKMHEFFEGTNWQEMENYIQ
uniref:Protein kinase domain-containing protein n=1 Tax=Glossina brevipalpis TaxID=37001 RepID=A0A1A9X222_9MUSC